MTFIDLRSDTKSPQSAQMVQAMSAADVGDEQIGEDPTVQRLCEKVADLLGKEAAIFLPSGTMCNQIAILSLTKPGNEIVLSDMSHVLNSESGGAAMLAGVQCRALPAERGVFTATMVKDILRPAKRNAPRASLVVVEQTTTGGAIWPLDPMKELFEFTRTAGLSLHTDGARLLNAQIASGVSAHTYGQLCDTIWLDLSKGLGCPVGAVLAGSAAFIEEAWQWKFRLGGAMRQAGYLAAAGLYALDHNVNRLSQDHENAQILAKAIAELDWAVIDPGLVETNIIHFDIAPSCPFSAHDVVRTAKAHGIGLGATGAGRIRAVTHLGVSREAIDTTIRFLKELD